MPNGSPSPCTTSTGTATASSSASRLGACVPLLRRGGCSGNARHRTPAAPVAAAVRQATRAPDERPPATSGRPASSPAAQVLDDRDPGRVEVVRRRRRAPAGDAVGLLDERHADAERHARRASRRRGPARRRRRPRRVRGPARRRARRPGAGARPPGRAACRSSSVVMAASCHRRTGRRGVRPRAQPAQRGQFATTLRSRASRGAGRTTIAAMPDRLYFTDSDEANALIASDPMALLVGFVLDQQVTVQKAFSGPLAIRERLGALDAATLADADLEPVFRERPAVHRYPGSMAKRVHDLAVHIRDTLRRRRRARLDRRRGRRRAAREHRRAAGLRHDEDQGARRGARQAVRRRAAQTSSSRGTRRSATSTHRQALAEYQAAKREPQGGVEQGAASERSARSRADRRVRGADEQAALARVVLAETFAWIV